MQLIYLHQPDEVTTAPVLRVEETEWTTRVAPVLFSLLAPSPWQFEQNEQAATLQTALDFSEWTNFVAPITASPVPLVFLSDDVFVTPAPVLGTDEDFWSMRPAPVASYSAPRVFAVDEEIVPTPPIQDEDFWTSGVAPTFAYPAHVFLDDDVFEITPPRRDEDYWTNPVAPIAAQNFLVLPYLPDVEEIPAGNLVILLQADVLGAGSITPQVSGAGSVTVTAGMGQASIATGDGRIN